jgi:hypothetical protein
VCTSCKRRGLRVQISGPRGRKSRPTCRDGKKVSIRWSVYTHLEHFRGAVPSREEEEEGEFVRWGKKKEQKKNLYLTWLARVRFIERKADRDSKRRESEKRDREKRTNASKTLLFPLD